MGVIFLSLYENYNEIGKSNINCSSDQFIQNITKEGLDELVINVLTGGNVRDVTEFFVRNRLTLSNMALLSLFIESDYLNNNNFDSVIDFIVKDFSNASNQTQRTLYLWLLGLTAKGYVNIVRGTDQSMKIYVENFKNSILSSIDILKDEFGEINGSITLNNKTININWEFLSIFLSAIGSQTLTLRGSAKSMNGKLFEKLVLGSLLSILDFRFCDNQPSYIDKSKKLFWLSNMDENERETDATIVYNGKAISIDIGFIGKGNPEITLDKVSRFGAYKRIGNIKHDMSTIIIVDTIPENTDLLNKASKVNGFVFQMIDKDWVLKFANKVCDLLNFEHPIQSIPLNKIDLYLKSRLDEISLYDFI